MFGDENSQPAETIEDIAAMMTDEPVEETDEADIEQDDEVTEDSSEVEESEDEESESDEDDDEESTVVLLHNGKEHHVTESERDALAQKGFDYTQKTMALGEERKAFEAERTEVISQRQTYQQGLQQNMQTLQAVGEFIQQDMGTPPDPSQYSDEDMGLYLRHKAQYDARQGQLAQIANHYQQLEVQSQRERQEQLNRRGAEAERVLKDTLEGWNDDMAEDLAKYASEHGLAPHEVDSPYVTAGFWQMLHKAQAYDKLQATKQGIKPTKTVTKVAKPSAAKGKQPEALRRANAVRAHSANPTIESLANLL